MYKTIIFDLDGTLLNTLNDLADSVNEMLNAHQWPNHPIEAYKTFVCDGAEMLIRRAIPDNKFDDEQIKQLTREYKSIYKNRMFLKTKPYDGIMNLLAELKKRSYSINVLSNKPHQETVMIVEKVLNYYKFDIIQGAQNEVPKKPNPAAALMIAQQLKILPNKVLYVGDTNVDMQTAVNAGMFGVGVLWGFREKKELEDSGAKIIISQPKELLKIIDSRASIKNIINKI